jgi:hypothetical protein
MNGDESLSIKCGFRGRPEPSITWLHNGQEIIIHGSPVTGKLQIIPHNQSSRVYDHCCH